MTRCTKYFRSRKYAWRFRYPGEPYEPESAEAQEALKKAEAAVDEIERRLRSVKDAATI